MSCIFEKNLTLRLVAANSLPVKAFHLNQVDRLVEKINCDLLWSEFADAYRQVDATVMQGKSVIINETFIDKHENHSIIYAFKRLLLNKQK